MTGKIPLEIELSFREQEAKLLRKIELKRIRKEYLQHRRENLSQMIYRNKAKLAEYEDKLCVLIDNKELGVVVRE